MVKPEDITEYENISYYAQESKTSENYCYDSKIHRKGRILKFGNKDLKV